jgi:REP element-mobilizing transposase RayT
MDYRYGSHAVYNIEYHFVWVTKYRYKVLTGDVALRVRELVRQTCERARHHTRGHSLWPQPRPCLSPGIPADAACG